MGLEAIVGSSGLFDREALQARQKALNAFNDWEGRQLPAPPPEDALARLDALLRLMPQKLLAARTVEDYAGVATLHAALAVLDGTP